MSYVMLVLALYLAWWQFRCFRPLRKVALGSQATIPITLHFNAPIAQFVWRITGKDEDAENFAITLPALFARRAHTFYARHFADPEHRRHEEGGHVAILQRIGPVPFLLTAGKEKEAVEREQHLPLWWFPAVGTK